MAADSVDAELDIERSANMDLDTTIILTLVSFIFGMVAGISLVRPNRSR